MNGWRSFGRVGANVIACALLLGAGCAAHRDAYRAALDYQRGTQALREQRSAEAARLLEGAARLAPQGSAIYNHLGLAYAQLGREEDSLEALERAVELDCENDAAHRNLALARAGRWALLRSGGPER